MIALHDPLNLVFFSDMIHPAGWFRNNNQQIRTNKQPINNNSNNSENNNNNNITKQPSKPANDKKETTRETLGFLHPYSPQIFETLLFDHPTNTIRAFVRGPTVVFFLDETASQMTNAHMGNTWKDHTHNTRWKISMLTWKNVGLEDYVPFQLGDLYVPC